MNTTTQTQELEKVIKEINNLDGETTVQLLVNYGTPEDFIGHLNNRDHLIDQALVRMGKITQEEATERYNQRNPETFEEMKTRLVKEAEN